MNLPPALRDAFRIGVLGLGRIGERALASATSTALEGAAQLTEEVRRRIKRAAVGAAGIAKGQPYKPKRDNKPFWPEQATVEDQEEED